MRSTMLAVAVSLLMPLGAAAAQTVRPKRGDIVRITAPPYALDNRIARVLSARNDTLFLDVDKMLAVARPGVTRLEVHSRRRHTLKGAGVGLLVGAAVGAIVGYADGDNPPTQLFRVTAGEKAVFLGIGMGGVGVVLGAIAGTGVVREHWTPVPLGTAAR